MKKKIISLAIESSTNTLSLAVARAEEILVKKNYVTNRDLSSKIMPCILKVVKLANLEIKNTDVFIVGLGPGSFTGLRVGCAAIKAMGYALKKPVIGVSSLDALAYGVKDKAKKIIVLQDAKRSLVFAAEFKNIKEELRPVRKHQLIDLDSYLKSRKGEYLIIGSGVDLYREQIVKHKQIKAIFLKKNISLPQASSCALLGLERTIKGSYDDVSRLTPTYLYPQDCQVQKK